MGLVAALLLLALSGVAFALLAGLVARLRESRHLAALAAAADELGLTLSDDGHNAHGTLGAHRLEVEYQRVREGDQIHRRTRLRLWGHGLPTRLRVRPTRFADTDAPALGAPGFERLVHLSGESEAELLARFDHRTREVVARAVDLGATFGDRTWLLDHHGPLDAGHRLAGTIRLVARCAELLSVSPRLADALLERAFRDPLPAVRCRAGLRLVAELAEGRAPPELLDALSREHDDPEVLLAVGALGGRAGRRALRRLSSHPSVEARCQGAARLADGLEPGDDPGLERHLIGLIPTGDLEVLRAVGRLCGADAVGELQKVAVVRFSERAREATAAIREIQSRVTVGRGALSVAQLDGGQVALAAPAPAAGRVGVAGR